MDKNDTISLYNGIHSVMGLVGVIFGYALNKNLEIMRPEIEALQKAITPSEKFIEYDKKRVEIVKKHALKDEKGDFIVNASGYDVGDNISIVEEEIKPLNEEYAKAIKDREDQIKEYNKLIKEDSSIKLYKVKLENLPKDITGEQQKAIFPIIEE